MSYSIFTDSKGKQIASWNSGKVFVPVEGSNFGYIYDGNKTVKTYVLDKNIVVNSSKIFDKYLIYNYKVNNQIKCRIINLELLSGLARLGHTQRAVCKFEHITDPHLGLQQTGNGQVFTHAAPWQGIVKCAQVNLCPGV